MYTKKIKVLVFSVVSYIYKKNEFDSLFLWDIFLTQEYSQYRRYRKWVNLCAILCIQGIRKV